MFRDELAAAHARIEALERELEELRSGASDELRRRIGELEEELRGYRSREAERRRIDEPARRRRRRIVASAVGFAVVVAAVVIVAETVKSDAEQCAEGVGSACASEGLRQRGVDPAAAERLLARACTLGVANGCFERALLAKQRNDEAAADRFFGKACDGGHAEGCASVAGRLVYRGESEALEVGKKACEMGSALGCSNWSSALAAADDLPAATSAARRACDGGSPSGCSHLAWFLLRDKKLDDALAAATRGSEIGAAHSGVQTSLGLVLTIHGDVEAAVAAFRRAVAPPNGSSSERPLNRRPVPVLINDWLEALRPIYPDKVGSIDQVLARRAEWNPD